MCMNLYLSIYLSIYLSSSLGSTFVDVECTFDFSLILFTVVLSAPQNQSSLLFRAWDWHMYHFLVPVAGGL